MITQLEYSATVLAPIDPIVSTFRLCRACGKMLVPRINEVSARFNGGKDGDGIRPPRQTCNHKCSRIMHTLNKVSTDGAYRICGTCKTWFPISNFYPHQNGKPAPNCKMCARIKAKQWASSNPNKIATRRSNLVSRLWKLRTSARGNARSRGLEFSLDRADIEKIWARQAGLCFYSGLPMEVSMASRARAAPSIDRVDSDRGYVLGNVVLCRWDVNRAKSDLGSVAFTDLCVAIANHSRDVPYAKDV